MTIKVSAAVTSLSGRTAIVTGAASGIGRATALIFARAGASVALLDRNEAGLSETVAMIGEASAPCFSIGCDITDDESVARAVKAANENGPVSILVHAAGGALPPQPLLEMDLEHWQRTLDVNLNGCFHLVRNVIPSLRGAGGGSIILTASSSGHRGGFGFSLPYSAAKGAILSMTRVLAAELSTFGIRVNSISPGMIDTPLTSGLLSLAGQRDAIGRNIPLARAGQPEEVANAALFLASTQSSYVTGADIVVDGGLIGSYWPRAEAPSS